MNLPIIELPRTCYRFDTHVRRQAAALRLQVSDVFGTIQEIDDLAKSRRGRILVDNGDAAEVVTAVQISCRTTTRHARVWN